MSIDSFDAVFYTAIFILPGFIISSIIDLVNPPKKYNEGKYLLKCLLLSIVNCAIWCWLYRIIIDCKNLSSLWHWILLVLVSLIGSTVIGLIIAIFKQHQFLDRFLWVLRVKTIHSTPTAWDYFFSKQESGFVIITLIDDSRLFGWYSSKSFTSSDPEERDIYIEIAYKVENDQWMLDEQSAGFYIPKDQIKVIEFKKGGNNNGGDEKEH